MAHYTVRSSSRQNQKMFRICGFSLMVVMLLFLGLSQTDWLDDRWSHMLGWTAMGLLGLALIGVYVLIFKESANKYWQKVSFDVIENKFVRVVDGQAPIEFPLNKISFIGESRSGLVVRGDEPSKAFVIPRAVEGFEQLRQQLSEHREVTPIKNKTSLVLILPLVLIIAVYALKPTSMQSVTDAGTSTLKNRISPADQNKYRSVSDSRDWQNPYLMVQANGINARPRDAAEVSTMSPADVVTYLEKLPSIAWPYGLVVAVQENGVRARGDTARIEKNREELLRRLKEAGVRAELWPSG